jgi:hypothetical protein
LATEVKRRRPALKINAAQARRRVKRAVDIPVEHCSRAEKEVGRRRS